MPVDGLSGPEIDRDFAGSVPALYEQLLVPMLFSPYARDLVARIGARPISALLELAAGTGAVTRELAQQLPVTTSIVATDLNQPMLDQAARIAAPRPIVWRQADALDLPFDDASFDAVVCQFGVMFFGDRVRAFAQARRVLRGGGVFVFNTWDRIEANDFPCVVQSALLALYAEEPPRFLTRTPYGYFELQRIRDDLTRAGFSAPAQIATLPAVSVSPTARAVARAFCQGTPLRSELERRGPDELARATDAVEAALVERFGEGPVRGALSALVVEVSA